MCGHEHLTLTLPLAPAALRRDRRGRHRRPHLPRAGPGGGAARRRAGRRGLVHRHRTRPGDRADPGRRLPPAHRGHDPLRPGAGRPALSAAGGAAALGRAGAGRDPGAAGARGRRHGRLSERARRARGPDGRTAGGDPRVQRGAGPGQPVRRPPHPAHGGGLRPQPGPSGGRGAGADHRNADLRGAGGARRAVRCPAGGPARRGPARARGAGRAAAGGVQRRQPGSRPADLGGDRAGGALAGTGGRAAADQDGPGGARGHGGGTVRLGRAADRAGRALPGPDGPGVRGRRSGGVPGGLGHGGGARGDRGPGRARPVPVRPG